MPLTGLYLWSVVAGAAVVASLIVLLLALSCIFWERFVSIMEGLSRADAALFNRDASPAPSPDPDTAPPAAPSPAPCCSAAPAQPAAELIPIFKKLLINA
ncbi:unnamed protein product [Strongylus vulgaris]|uniref:Uncharacterized protein n=1 Tax=Strongylus vulgaris TaxID=40348 RepID=A0A3P7JAD8_STRVU|nr:unnamed protein product [Strongylus vulgaris]